MIDKEKAIKKIRSNILRDEAKIGLINFLKQETLYEFCFETSCYAGVGSATFRIYEIAEVYNITSNHVAIYPLSARGEDKKNRGLKPDLRYYLGESSSLNMNEIVSCDVFPLKDLPLLLGWENTTIHLGRWLKGG